MIAVDASVLIGHLNTDDANRAAADWLLREYGPDTFAVSQLTMAEVLVKPARDGHLQQIGAALRRLGVKEVPFGRHASVRLALLRAETNLKMPDCCVLLAAEDIGATAILTLDDRMRDQGRRLGFDCPDGPPTP